MSRRKELEALNGLQLMELVEKHKIDPNCKRAEAIEKILEAEGVKEEKKTRPPRNHANTRLKALRVAAGITQKDFANLIGINLGTLKHYEQGSRCFDSAKFDVIFTACMVLNCKIEDLLENEEWADVYKQYKNKHS